MIIVSVVYPVEGSTRFDHEYYRSTHLPMVGEGFGPLGLRSASAIRGIGAAGGGPAPIHAIATISFDTVEEVAAAMQSEAGQRIVADIATFTDSRPIIQVNQPVG